MTPKARLVIGALFAWLAGSAPARVVHGAPESAAHTSRTPILSISVNAGYRGQAAAAGGLALVPDDWSTAFVTSESQGCGSGFSMASPGATPAVPDDRDSAVMWMISARLVNVQEDLANIDLRWQRAVHDAGLVPNEDVRVETRVQLREDTKGVLDLVRGDAAKGQCESVAVLIGLDFSSRTYVADAAISYDMWLVQRDADGHETTDRFRTVGRQGRSLDFFFRRLPYAKDGSRIADTNSAPVGMRISGLVTGSASVTGMIDLTLDAERLFEAGHGAVGTSGRKRLSMRSGETVEFEVPAPVRGGLASVGELAGPFGGMRTAIRVTPTVLWSEAARH
jgi:hypothetical protein